MSYKYLLDIALILLSTKFLGLLTRRFNLPQVVGALLAGVILGPSVLNILKETDFLSMLAELGVIVLMFTAGLESDIKELKSVGKSAFVVATMGVIIPLIGGTVVAYIFNDGSLPNVSAFSSVKIGLVLLKIVGFLIFAAIVGYLIYLIFGKWISMHNVDKRRFVIGAFVICLLMSFSAEQFFGVADITGAFVAGLVLSQNKETSYISRRFDIISYMLLSPIFFASIGIEMKIPSINSEIILMTIVLVLVAMLSKVIGCGLGAKICGYNKNEVIQIGTGMMARGEVALIIANKGLKMGVMNMYFLPAIIIMVVICAITTPIILKKAYSHKTIKEKV